MERKDWSALAKSSFREDNVCWIVFSFLHNSLKSAHKHTNMDKWIFTIKLKGQTPAFLPDSKNKSTLFMLLFSQTHYPVQVLCILNVKIISFKTVLEQLE